MEKADLWRWAHHSFVGFMIGLLSCMAVPDLILPIIYHQFPDGNVAAEVIIITVLAYFVGILAWGVVIRFRNAATLPMFYVFRKSSFGARDYRMFRVRYCEEIEGRLRLDGYESSSPWSYERFGMELMRVVDKTESAYSKRIAAEWESCTLLLVLSGCVLVSFVGSLLNFVAVMSVSVELAASCPLLKTALLAFIYLGCGISLIERNKLLVRDVVRSSRLRDMKGQMGQT